MQRLMLVSAGNMVFALCAFAAVMSPALQTPDATSGKSAATRQTTGVEDPPGIAVQRAAGGVTGGPHDLSKLTGRFRDTCSACHVPHVLGVRAESEPGAATNPNAPSGRASQEDAERGVPKTGGTEGQKPGAQPVEADAAEHPSVENAGAGASLQMYRIEGQRSALTPGRFTPGPTSLICLSCHDGTVASSAIGGAHALLSGVRDGFDVPDGFVWRDHPIGVEYPAQKKGYVPLSKIEAQGHIRLPAQRVECVSCHDPHNAAGEPYLLSVSNRRSALCLSCHVK